VQNLDTTDPVSGSTNNTTDPPDLPAGWHQSHLSRHENYDPAIVTVFAVILVCAILATIGLCRWRTRRLRRLRDLERLEKQKKGEDGSDTETLYSSSLSESSGHHDGDSASKEKRGKAGSDKNANHKGSKSSGKSNAFRKANERIIARLRRRYRSKAAATDAPSEAGNPVTENNTNTPALAITSEETSENASRITVQSPTRLENVRHEDASPINPNQAVDEAPPSTTTAEASSPSSSHRRLREPSEPSTPIPPNELRLGEPPPVPTTSPPAYLGSPSISRRNEKRPLRGLENDYDDRDMATYRANHVVRTQSSQRRTRREITSNSSLQDSMLSIETEPHYSDTIPDEPLPPIDATIRVAAGATRQAHLATDDKATLERMRALADEPSYSHSSGHPRYSHSQPSSASQEADQLTALAPTWGEMEQWHMDQQIQEHAQSEDVEDVLSRSAAGPSKNTIPNLGFRAQPSTVVTLFPALPPPPTLSFISQSTSEGEVSLTHTLGHVWNQLQSRSSPSAPEPEPSHRNMPSNPDALLPSAPPCLDDEEIVPSAPPIWDDEDDEAEASGEERLPNASVPSTSAAHSSFTQERSNPLISNRRQDGSSSEEEGPNSQWPADLRTTRREGAGLPKYEP
jgi:hypothetical protein